MGDDSDGILSEIADVVGDVAGEAVDELKEFGQSAASQISGHAGQTAGQQARADISKVKSAVTGSAGDQSAEDVVRGFGKSFTSQITGHTDLTSGDITKMVKADTEFSKVESEKVKAKIKQIYQEYAAKRAREQQQQVAAKQQEEQTKQLVEQNKTEEMIASNPAIAKTRAEIKNYGAE